MGVKGLTNMKRPTPTLAATVSTEEQREKIRVRFAEQNK